MTTSPAYAEKLIGRLASAVERQAVDEAARLTERVGDVLVGALLFDNRPLREALHRGVERAYSALRAQRAEFVGRERLEGILEALTSVTGLAILRQRAAPATSIVRQPRYRRVLEVLMQEAQPLSNKTIAERAGLGPEWVARLMPELRAAGMVASARHWKELLNELTPKAREALADAPRLVGEEEPSAPIPEPELPRVEEPRKPVLAREDFRAVLERYQTRIPVDLFGMARDLGVEVELKDTLGKNSGMIVRETREVGKGQRYGYRILVNSTEMEVRRRFTLAHEFAHLELHQDQIGDGVLEDALYRGKNFSEPEELEANKRAAEIVMPEPLVREAFRAQTDTARLADMFKVSKRSMQWRLEELGLAPPRP
jgi:hypothetical protein